MACWRPIGPGSNDLVRDVRMRLPVCYDLRTKKWRVWVCLGWEQEAIAVAFDRAPAIPILDSDGHPVGEDQAVPSTDDVDGASGSLSRGGNHEQTSE